jgi:hypothetical protein
VTSSASDGGFDGLRRVEASQGRGRVQGRSEQPPHVPRGPVLSTPTPDHSGTDESGKAARCGCRYKRTSNT